MITFFTIPRGGSKHTKVLRQAVKSWRKAAPKSQVILFGDETGIDTAAKSLNAKHIKEVELNEYGTPIISGVWEQAEELAKNEWLCEISADIVLEDTDLKQVLSGLSQVSRPFVIGRRLDIVAGRTDRILHSPAGVDYFLYRRGTIGEIPPFAVGRTAYDNWLVWAALVKWHMWVVDATEVIHAVHDKHDYPTKSGTKEELLLGKERAQNIALAQQTGCNRWCGVDYATHKMRSNYTVIGVSGGGL